MWLLLLGCSGLVPTPGGAPASGVRTHDAFDAIDAGSSIDVKVTIAPGETEVNVIAPAGTQESVITEVADSALKIRSKSGIFNGKREVHVRMPNLLRVHAEGAGDINVIGIDGGPLHIELKGSSELRFDGNPDDLRATLKGSSDLYASGLDGTRLEITAGGSGDVETSGRVVAVDVTATGSAEVRIEDIAAKRVEVQTSGSADIVLIGATEVAELTTSRAGDINASKLSTGTATVDQRGTGELELHVEKSVDGMVRGPGDLWLSGPGTSNVQTERLGSVKRR